MENHSLIEWLPTAIPSVIAVIFGSKIFADWIAHRRQQGESKSIAHLTNEGKLIDMDQVAFQMVTNEVQELRQEVRELRERIDNHIIEKADLRSENATMQANEANLKEELLRLRERQHDFAAQIQKRDLRIQELEIHLKQRDQQVMDLQASLKETRDEVHQIREQLRGK